MGKSHAGEESHGFGAPECVGMSTNHDTVEGEHHEPAGTETIASHHKPSPPPRRMPPGMKSVFDHQDQPTSEMEKKRHGKK